MPGGALTSHLTQTWGCLPGSGLWVAESAGTGPLDLETHPCTPEVWQSQEPWLKAKIPEFFYLLLCLSFPYILCDIGCPKPVFPQDLDSWILAA